MPCRSGELTSSEIVNATAHSSDRPCSSTACRASLIPSRATSIQWPSSADAGWACASASGADRIDHVLVEITWHPAATYRSCTSRTACGAR